MEDKEKEELYERIELMLVPISLRIDYTIARMDSWLATLKWLVPVGLTIWSVILTSGISIVLFILGGK